MDSLTPLLQGNYDQFDKQKEENFRALMNEYRAQQDKHRKLKEFIEQYVSGPAAIAILSDFPPL